MAEELRRRDGRIFVIGLALLLFLNIMVAAISGPRERKPLPPPAAPPREPLPPPPPQSLPKPDEKKEPEEDRFPEIVLWWAAMVAMGLDPMDGSTLPVCAVFPPIRM